MTDWCMDSHRQLGSLWSVRPRDETPLTLWCASYRVCHVVELFSHQSYANALILDAARWFVLICSEHIVSIEVPNE